MLFSDALVEDRTSSARVPHVGDAGDIQLSVFPRMKAGERKSLLEPCSKVCLDGAGSVFDSIPFANLVFCLGLGRAVPPHVC